MYSPISISANPSKTQSDCLKADSLQENLAFSRAIKHSDKIYTHIELGAGNYRYNDNSSTAYSCCMDTEKVHIESCSCDGCDYSKNRYRYAALESTIHHIVTQSEEPINRFLLNDVDCISLDQAVKHAKKYIEVDLHGLQKEISIETILGNFYKIPFSEYQPTSIHLKNPEDYFFQDAYYNFKNTVARLFEESSGCRDGGFILVTEKENILKLKPILQSIDSNLFVDPYELPFDASYHGLQPTVSNSWHVKSFAYLCKKISYPT